MPKPPSREILIGYLLDLKRNASGLSEKLIEERSKGDLVFGDVSEDIEDLQRFVNLLKIEANIEVSK